MLDQTEYSFDLDCGNGATRRVDFRLSTQGRGTPVPCDGAACKCEIDPGQAAWFIDAEPFGGFEWDTFVLCERCGSLVVGILEKTRRWESVEREAVAI